MDITKVKELRERTNISLDKCKAALEETDGDIDAAILVLQKKGLADSVKKASRECKEGVIQSYIHGNKIGVMVEVNCETDFAARSEPFLKFVEDVLLQVASMDPLYLSVEHIPFDMMDVQKEIAKEQMASKVQGKPEAVVAKIMDGKIKAWFRQVSLLNQISVVNSEKTIEEMKAELISKLGENVVIKRFVRWEL